jgi:hypothetical protein
VKKSRHPESAQRDEGSQNAKRLRILNYYFRKASQRATFSRGFAE